MIITNKIIITLIPIIIIELTIFLLLLNIILIKNYLLNFLITIIGLFISLLSLFYSKNNIPIYITKLLYIDNFSIIYISIILFFIIINTIFSYKWILKFSYKPNEFYLLILINSIGSIVLSYSNHLITLILGLELISITLFGMIGYNINNKKTLEVTIKYIILSSVSLSFILFGMSIIYAKTGQQSFIELKKILIHHNNFIKEPMFLLGFILILIGIGFKLSLVPFHIWTTDIYNESPEPSSMFLATTTKISILIVLIKLILYTNIIKNIKFNLILSIISFSSMIFGSLMALNQINIKKILGYSSITNFGYILIPVIYIKNNNFLFESIGISIISYLLSNIILFGIISIIKITYNKVIKISSIDSYKNLFWYSPILSISFSIAILSLAGIPLTLGFINKLYILIISINNNSILLTSGIIISSFIGFYYYINIIILIFLYPKNNFLNNKFKNNKFLNEIIIIFIISIIIIILGIYPKIIINLMKKTIILL